MTILKAPVTSKDHIRGNVNAPITLLEYGDYECPYCGMAHSIIKRVQKHLGEQLRFVYRHFPLTELHPHAEIAAQAAEFAGAHGHFWEMHDLIYENQKYLDIDLLLKLAKMLKLSDDGLLSSLKNRTYLPKIQNDMLTGEMCGVHGTPTFFLNGHLYTGSYEFEDLVSVIEQVANQ
ncbi:MAG: disulfide bond formation protein DsbA [Candidatus Amoebophilus sp. 36-38]|nr:MAG: disulfide bond formation protein DsbA [Candidatus Amoebophilus sp. 36-38]